MEEVVDGILRGILGVDVLRRLDIGSNNNS